MASKEATVFIIDLGATTAETHAGRDESDLEYGMRYVWDKISGIMMANRVTLNVGVLGFRTDETKNALDEDEDYANITVLKELGPMQLPHLKTLQAHIKPNKTNNGDAISAIVLAIELINEKTQLKSGKPGKYVRKIILMTDGRGCINPDMIDEIASKLNESEIDLIVIGIDFDDLEFGFKEEDKPENKRENEKILKNLADECTNGIFATTAEAVAQLSLPDVKITRPYSTFKGRLCLGDPVKYPETAMVIDVERYFRTHAATAPSASSFVALSQTTNGAASQQSSKTLQGDTEMSDAPSVGGNLTAIRNTRIYLINDPEGINGKKTVLREDLAKGYEYGRTAVHMSESDENVTKLQTKESFDIIGFIPNDKYERFLNIGESRITVAQKINEKASMALSSLVHALFELDSCAVARIVTKDGKDPEIVLLAPLIEPDLEALFDVPLPFAEDVRAYRFPPLDRVIAPSGGILTKHRYIPGDDLVNAMSEYVDSMDISTFGKDDDGNPTEYMPVEDTFSPIVHRLNQAIRRRAVKPDESIAPPAEILIKYSTPPKELVEMTASQLAQLIKAADIHRVPPKAKGKRARKEQAAPLSEIDVEALLNQDDRVKRQKLDPNNSIPDFKRLTQAAIKDDEVRAVAKQMGEVIRGLIKNNKYDQAIANMHVMREEIAGFDLADLYNDFMLDLKKGLLTTEEFSGPMKEPKEFFLNLKKQKLGLISAEESEKNEGIPAEEAADYFSLKTVLPGRSRN